MAKDTIVYVLIEDYITDSTGDNVVEVVMTSTDEKKVEARLHELAESYKQEDGSLWDEDDEQFEDFSDETDYFSCWENGCYSQNHYTLSIKESVLE